LLDLTTEHKLQIVIGNNSAEIFDTPSMLMFDYTAADLVTNKTTDVVKRNLLLPKWAKIVDQDVYKFLQSYSLEKDLLRCLDAIRSVARVKVKIRLEHDYERNRQYVTISFIFTRSNESKMADYIYNSNIKIAQSLPGSNLQYFVTTME